jgi:hypothetical protein
VRFELEEARKNNDVVKVLCLDAKLNEIDVAIQAAKDRHASMELASKRGDDELVTHEFTIFQHHAERIADLEREAKQCVGKELGFTGESSVTATQDPLPDNTDDYPGEQDILELPNCASCYR